MKKVIIGIHGLGNKPARQIESRWWRLAMKEGLRRIGKSTWLPKFELVYWADLLYEKPLDTRIKDSNDALYLEEPYLPGSKELPEKENHDFRKKVLDYVESQLDKLFLNNDYSINYSSMTDVIMHKYFSELEAYYTDRFRDSQGIHVRVRAEIRQRLAAAITKYRDYEIMLIGHSMGSIIAYDVLTFQKPSQSIDWFVTIGSPLGFPIVQGKIAAEWKATTLPVSRLKTPPDVLKKWLNFADLHDRIAIIWQLGKNYSPNTHGVVPFDREVRNDYSNGKSANAHKSYGYLRTQEFAESLSVFIGEITIGKKLLAATFGKLF